MTSSEGENLRHRAVVTGVSEIYSSVIRSFSKLECTINFFLSNGTNIVREDGKLSQKWQAVRHMLQWSRVLFIIWQKYDSLLFAYNTLLLN
jgi:hypothetical protein